MSNLIFNLRVLYWHLHIMRDAPFMRLSFNRYWWGRGIGWSLVRAYPVAIWREDR